MYKRLPLIIALLASAAFSQRTLKPGVQYTFDSAMVAYTEHQFRKNDSLLKLLDLRTAEISLLEKQSKLSSEIEDSLKSALSVQVGKSALLQDKIKLLDSNDSLRAIEVKAYRDLFTETNKSLLQERSHFGNETFWYVMGFLSGAAAIYVSSVVLHNSTK